MTISLFGPLRVQIGGETVPRFRTRSIGYLLALLTLRQGRDVSRSHLAGTLWPDSDEAQALQNLRHDLVVLRKALGPESVRLQSPTRDSLMLDLTGADVDVLRFDAAIQSGDENSLRVAVSAYSGPFLEDCSEEWAVLERESRHQAYLRALETLADAAEKRGDLTDALMLARWAEARDNLSDAVQRRLMRVLAASGDTPAALMAYRDYRLRLRREGNLAPDAETTRLYEAIRAGRGERKIVPAPAPGDDAPDAEWDADRRPRPDSLPHPVTALIGREEIVREVAAQIAASRLVTLAGAGGIGKTRLSIEIAREVAANFPGGVAFIPLASLPDAAPLAGFVAAALGFREEKSSEPDALREALAGGIGAQSLLLVLDNCEHLIDAVAQLTQFLLERCPNLHVLATSRQRLGLTGEIVWRVPSLTAPDPELLASEEDGAAQAMQFPAVRLFVERAAMARPGFRLADAADALTVARICQRLDGIPLTIELAAAWVGVLPLPQIAARLDDKFRLLTSGSRAVLPRHQTLRALIDWSYDLLEAPERAALRLFSVFVGGWTLDAAEAVLRSDDVVGRQNSVLPTDHIITPFDILELLASLTDKSLILAEEREGTARYRMLETVREYGAEKRREAGEATEAAGRHLAYFVRRAQEIAPHWEDSDTRPVLSLVESDLGNFRAALQRANAQDAPPDAALRLMAALWPYWESRGVLSEGCEYLRAALDRPTLPDAPERAAVLLGLATLTFVQGERQAARGYAEESLRIARQQDDPRRMTDALILLGHITMDMDDYSLAASRLEEALAHSRSCGWTRGVALALTYLGVVARLKRDFSGSHSRMEQALSMAEKSGHGPTIALALYWRGHVEFDAGDYAAATLYLERSLAIWSRLGNQSKASTAWRYLGYVARRQEDLPRSQSCLEGAIRLLRGQSSRFELAHALYDLAGIFLERGDLEAARDTYAESLELYIRTKSPSGQEYTRNMLGIVQFRLGEAGAARRLHREAMAIYVEQTWEAGILWTAERFGIVAAATGDPATAARLFGAAFTGRERLGSPPAGPDFDNAVAAIRAALGEEEFSRLWAEGCAMPLGEAAALVLSGVA